MKKEPKQEWKPKEGEEVWIKVFSNWSLGKYIGYDVDKKVHLVREPEEGGGHLFSSPYILHYSALPNEPKQETLEEFIDKVDTPSDFDQFTFDEGIRVGAKWQSERMYSEEDLILLLNFVSKEYNITNGIGWFCSHDSIEEIQSKDVLNNWFEQFKKK